MVDSFDWNLFDSSTPSRRSEILAVEYLRRAYGKQSPLSILDKGNSDGIDFEIRLSGHLVGLGEVKADLNPVRQSLMSEMQKRKLYRVVLPPGSGAWTVKLLPRAKVRNLEGTLRSLVAALNAKQRTALSINDCSDEEQLKVEHPLRRAGIEFLRKDADLRDLAFVHLPGVAGTMSDGGALIRSWLGEVFEVHSGKLSLKTLEDADVAEKHFFVWIGDNSPAQLQMTALLDPESPPKDEPSLPDWVTHIWLGVPASSSEDRFLWHHTKPRGWQVVRFDAMCRSKPN